MPTVTVALLSASWGIALVSGIMAATPMVRRRPRPAILGMFAVCVALAWWRWMNHVVPLHHVMYVDEPWYLEAARSLLDTGRASLCRTTWAGVRCDPYPKSVGWPLVLGAVFRFAPATDVTGMLVSKAAGALGIVVAGTGTAAWSGRPSRGLLASALLAFFPAHLAWSSTAETNVAGATVLMVAVFALLAWIRSPRRVVALCATSWLAIAASIRPEMSLVFAPTALAIGITRTSPRERETAAVFLVAFACVAAIAAWPMVRLNARVSQGAFLSLAQVSTNAVTLARTPGVGSALSMVAVLAVVGTVVAVRAGHPVEAMVLTGSGVGMALVVLAFDPRHFADRMLLGPLACFVPLVAIAGDLVAPRWVSAALSTAGVAATLVAARPAFDAMMQIPETQVLETALPRLVRRSIRPDALVITEWPTVLRAGTDVRSVMSTRDALDGGVSTLLTYATTHEVYFACDMFCEPGFAGAAGVCATFGHRVGLRPVARIGGDGRRYGLFRVTADVPSIAGCTTSQ